MAEGKESSVTFQRVRNATAMAAGYLVFSAAVWSFFTSPRKHEWVDVLIDYSNHRRSQYSENFLSIYKIPNHYSNYRRLSLYFGDWRMIKSDCVYLNSKKELDRLLVLSRIANYKIPAKYATGVNEEGLIECADCVKNCKFIYFGDLSNFTPRDDLKSLLVPLDLLHSNAVDVDANRIKSLANLLEGIAAIDKVVLCTNDNETWITHHKSLKYQ
ncbi:conserved hypothetical protein [Theileria orientalis strain Shintoku]|uniref:Uncharacterized protein n=1 Tax=Theileria orientalis strain Shintoku TaxID=869250 RepID=J4C2P0_THEOR|nr:conserved hypothetical protein [Theileria orientalis strain Shintoku]PVC50090.1 hypothetical protein MACL_00002540 [Theileria orientalis]BAM39026.1 conserved hypothetical protein [Theileria orientalis strain Shintoku]|eukprot:XP_009689327.1 conserved hypothetical protein [Theileria orientalis strain Shintoku]